MRYLPRAVPPMLGEDLAIPSTPTWWCGGERRSPNVYERLDELAIDGAFMRRPLLSWPTARSSAAQLTADERRALMERLTTRGHDYVGQELGALSTTPVWGDGRLQPRPMSAAGVPAPQRTAAMPSCPAG